MAAPDLAEPLMRWFATHARDLPWRRPETTPWGILVSEFMLQQTPVRRVGPVWTQWRARWPLPSMLAAASRADVLRAWGKLGYPRRALRLHATASVIAAQYDDVVPADLPALEALPGVGSYTARAVAAFGYGRRCAVVDTNVRRVVARVVHGVAEAGPARTTADLTDVAALLPASADSAARFSAALMELGAVVCAPRSPRCGECPLRDRCAWRRAGRPVHSGPVRVAQPFAGTDRQVRGRLLDVLRAAPGPVAQTVLDGAWPDASQRERCLTSLLADGLATRLSNDRIALPDED